MNDSSITLDKLIDRYIALETKIRKLTHHVAHPLCRKCQGGCCRQEICKESIDSAFLYILINIQKIQYDSKNGWIGPSGCRLNFGRPLVCYQFFCNEVIESALYKSVGIQAIINDFVSIGKSAHGDVHLICIDNLEILSPQKIEKICYKIKMLMKEV